MSTKNNIYTQTITQSCTSIDFVPKDTGVYKHLITNQSHATLVYVIRKSVDIEIEVDLMSAGTRATVVGIVLGNARDTIRLHTIQHHKSRDTVSTLLVKSVLDGRSKFTFHGDIIVDKHAQKTDAYQRNENLLLTTDSSVQTQPSLEILADDVRCTHAATVSTIDEESMFYLMSRGLTNENARNLVVQGFIKSALSGIDDSTAVSEVHKKLWYDVQQNA